MGERAAGGGRAVRSPCPVLETALKAQAGQNTAKAKRGPRHTSLSSRRGVPRWPRIPSTCSVTARGSYAIAITPLISLSAHSPPLTLLCFRPRRTDFVDRQWVLTAPRPWDPPLTGAWLRSPESREAQKRRPRRQAALCPAHAPASGPRCFAPAARGHQQATQAGERLAKLGVKARVGSSEAQISAASVPSAGSTASFRPSQPRMIRRQPGLQPGLISGTRRALLRMLSSSRAPCLEKHCLTSPGTVACRLRASSPPRCSGRSRPPTASQRRSESTTSASSRRASRPTHIPVAVFTFIAMIIIIARRRPNRELISAAARRPLFNPSQGLAEVLDHEWYECWQCKADSAPSKTPAHGAFCWGGARDELAAVLSFSSLPPIPSCSIPRSLRLCAERDSRRQFDPLLRQLAGRCLSFLLSCTILASFLGPVPCFPVSAPNGTLPELFQSSVDLKTNVSDRVDLGYHPVFSFADRPPVREDGRKPGRLRCLAAPLKRSLGGR